MERYQTAPELITSQWFNASEPITLSSLLGRVVVIEAFQMLCPGCVSHAIPQAIKIHELFREEGVAVIGLHTVFEHHAAMTPVSLEAFIHEYRIAFPVAVDAASDPGPIPQTMAAYQMRGTPTTILIDRAGNLRKQYFGAASDMALGAEIMSLLRGSSETVAPAAQTGNPGDDCNEEGCPLS